MKAMIGESMNWKTIGCLGRNKNSNNRKITGASSFGWSVFLFWGGWKSMDGNPKCSFCWEENPTVFFLDSGNIFF